MASNVRKGDLAENRAKAILRKIGYDLAAQAKRSPVWRRGKVVANDGDIDLVGNSVDLIMIRKGHRTLFVQTTHVGCEGPRRAKLRAVPFDPAFHEAMLFAWSEERQHFAVYRDVDDYLAAGWFLRLGDSEFPWVATNRQVPLP